MINDNAKRKEFLDILDKKILVSDGSMGATLMASGFSVLPDSLNLDSTQIKEIIDIHLGYLKAGSDIIITNTLNSTPTKLEFHGLRNKIKEINENAVSAVNEAIDIYRTTSGDNKPIFIAGDIGPLGKLLDPFDPLKYEEALDSFSEQADVLIGKVDLIAIETIMDLNEALIAIKAIRKISEVIPIACSLTFCENAGTPALVDGKTIYDETPEIMASNISKFLIYKPSILGACCGSKPEHIKEIVKIVRDYNNRH